MTADGGSPSPEASASECLNCATPLAGRYCVACGQDSHGRRAPFTSLASELIQTFIAFDSVVLRSVPKLLLRPGRLTRDYLEGRRASQVAPLRLYLFLSVLFFLFVSIPKLDVSGSEVRVGDAVIEPPGAAAADQDGSSDASESRSPSVDTVAIDLGDFGDGWLGRRMQRQQERFEAMSPQQLVDSLVQAINGTIPKVVILFVPLLALVLRLLFVFTGWLYFDHLIFTLHLQASLFLMLLVVAPLSRTPLFSVTFGLVLLWIPVHWALSFRTAYGLRGAALWVRLALFAFAYTLLLGAMLPVVALYATATA